MPTFCRKPEVASFFSYLIQPYTKLCHRQNSDKHTDEIIHPIHLRLASLYFLASHENMRGASRLRIAQLNNYTIMYVLKHGVVHVLNPWVFDLKGASRYMCIVQVHVCVLLPR